MKAVSAVAPAMLALLGACAVQPAYQRPALDLPATWHNASGADAPLPAMQPDWWTALGDPAVDRLVASGLADNPTLAEAIARVDQARAMAGVQDARRLPAIGATGNLGHSAASGRGTTDQTSAGIGLSLGWELDLWGRVRESAAAARHRLDARTADAEAARLSIVGEIADTALALRACNLVDAIRERDIASREAELAIVRTRIDYGQAAPVEAASAQSNLALARTEQVAQEESCRRLVDALVALCGVDAGTVEQLLTGDLPSPPPFAPALPATVLLTHPAVVAAEREVAARWSEIAVARADRLPRIDLTALLTGQWLRTLGSSDTQASGSIGAGLSVPLLDGGAGLANVRFAEAAYREALARLVSTLRTTVREIEDALAAQQSAAARIETSREALAAAQFTLTASEARLRFGAIASYEMEEARRQFRLAQESAITARADLARAWVALVRRTGPGWSAGR
ncbi:efflux transporter outer membrane subunit [Sphingomonas sp. AOB5]|uniref:efflux transporter outer membrane subunit n=1 Tax=Sphingomonas sp. AOB5 TaxID=3034017 RepID=UPI0023F8017C|nr:efflux transporter outer membrane subunit [Sphingomonas sp. AOB5]MDF7774072.1 efflux transporter outer membrane subunit [Sphingomonas sp. AOB5]